MRRRMPSFERSDRIRHTVDLSVNPSEILGHDLLVGHGRPPVVKSGENRDPCTGGPKSSVAQHGAQFVEQALRVVGQRVLGLRAVRDRCQRSSTTSDTVRASASAKTSSWFRLVQVYHRSAVEQQRGLGILQ